MNWFLANILNSLLFGVSSSVSKVPGKYGVSGLKVLQWAFFVGSILGLIFFILKGNFYVNGQLLLICAIWAVTGTFSFLATI